MYSKMRRKTLFNRIFTQKNFEISPRFLQYRSIFLNALNKLTISYRLLFIRALCEYNMLYINVLLSKIYCTVLFLVSSYFPF